MKRFWNKLTGEERLCRAEQKLTILILDCQDEERRVKLIHRKKEVHLKRLKIRRRNYIFALILSCMMLILAVYGVVRVIGKTIKNVPSGQKQTEQPAESETQTETEDTTRINLTLNFTGDCILGTDEQFAWDSGFNAYYEANGPEYFLKNVRDIFEKDDLTIINMEGTLTEETTRADKQFAFKGDPEFVKILTSSSVEAANMANNHSHDYGEQSFQDTVNTLEENGIKTFGYDDTSVIEVKGVKIGFFGIYELDDHLERIPQVKSDIAKLKEDGAEIIVAVFHWSNELVTVPDENQVTLAHLAIDEGADVVVGHHPHIIQGIGGYKGKTIAYSLGNFCFGGNTNPTEMDTIIFQQKFTVNGKHEIVDASYEVIPCSVSSAEGYNNYQPTPLTGEAADQVLQKLEERSQSISE